MLQSVLELINLLGHRKFGSFSFVVGILHGTDSLSMKLLEWGKCGFEAVCLKVVSFRLPVQKTRDVENAELLGQVYEGCIWIIASFAKKWLRGL